MRMMLAAMMRRIVCGIWWRQGNARWCRGNCAACEIRPTPDQLHLAWARQLSLGLGAEGAESGVGVLSAGYVPGTAGDGIDIPEAEALQLMLDPFPVPDCLCEKDCVAAVKMRPELFVAQRFGVIVLLRTH